MIVLTENWKKSIPYMQFFSIALMTKPLATSCHQAILALGRSDIAMYIMGLINVTGLVVVYIACFLLNNVWYVAYSLLLSEFVSCVCFSYVLVRYFKYSIREQFRDLYPIILCLMGMFISTLIVDYVITSIYKRLLMKTIIGILSYVIISYIIKLDVVTTIKNKLFK